MDINQKLKQSAFTCSKKFGQNFITDTNLLNAIVSDAQICASDAVIEVGTGAGTLTKAISQRALKVISFEIDTRLEPILKDVLGGIDNVQTVFADILKVGYMELARLTNGQNYKVVANLPYYITTPIIFYFLQDANCVSLNIMVQKEVAERLTAKEGSAEYGAVTVQVKAYGNAKITRIVKRNMFNPAPNVDSAVVNIDIDRNGLDANHKLLSRVIAAAFDMRRKTLANNLIKNFPINKKEAEQIISGIGLNINIRGEMLSLADFRSLTAALSAVGIN